MSSASVRSPIRAVVFDLGGVLIDWDPRYLYRTLFNDERTMEVFLSEICTLEWHAAHDRGTPFAESCAALATDHPEHAELIWAWSERSEEMVAGTLAGTVDILHELTDAGVPCYALTNMEAETFPRRRERFAFMDRFDGFVVSSHEGVAKPDPEIFRRLLERFDLRPAKTLMIDDAPPNIAAAAALGMPAVLFQSPRQLRSELVRAGLLAHG